MNQEYRYYENEDCICFTTDLDWAPEKAIEQMLDFFKEYEICPTVFVTHESEIIKKNGRKINLGIHPNFVQPSSHGNSITNIIDYCQNLVPDTKVFRCHRWYASNDIYEELWKRGFRYESNICTNMDIVKPFIHRSQMLSFPVFFEDGAFIQHGYTMDYKEIENKFRLSGIKVINIHPMHFVLNTPYFKYTREIKDRLSRDEWNKMTEETLNSLSFKGKGIREIIISIVEDAKNRNAKIVTLKELYNQYKEEINE